jgi:4-hydroxybenzoate polyprenyltransferase
VYKTTNNARTIWYRSHKKFITYSQLIFGLVSIIVLLYIFIKYFKNILSLPFIYWVSIIVIVLAAILYYGLLPKSFFKYNLRNTGWLKAFVIGFVWACCANVAPLIMLKIEGGQLQINIYLWAWLFIKNWMFCTVNAIMFDVKDYPTDANLQLRTFIVRFGLRKTIYVILIPLSVIGLVALCFFAYFNHFTALQLAFNILPFLLTIYLAYALHKRKSNLFYLIVIDGLIGFKAVCGIIGIYFAHNQ